MDFMKRIFFILLMPIIFLSSCTIFTVRNTYYSNTEMSLLDKTLNALEYGYGFDYELNMNYIYSYSYSKDNLPKKEKAFLDIINNTDFKSVLDLYEKILKLQALTEYKINKYETDMNWKNYTFIKEDLYEPLNTYSSMLSRYILQKNENLAGFYEMRKKSYQKEVVLENMDKDTISDTF